MRNQWILAGMLTAAIVAGAGRAAAIQLSPVMAETYAVQTPSTPPTASNMMVCYGFVCRRRVMLDFTPGDRAALAGLLAAGRGSPAAERRAVQQAVVWFDRRVGRLIGTTARVARADFRASNPAGNFDCFDTTRNTMGLLLVLQEGRLLRHHTVADPRHRGRVLIGQTPHNTAVLRERASGQHWAIDMWTKAYGQLPDIMTVEKWLTED